MSNVIKLRPHKTTHTKTETMLLTSAEMNAWKNPPFQRPQRINEKVRALAEEVASNGGVLPGVITLGKLGRDIYLIDGQHRRAAGEMSGEAELWADVRTHEFADMGEMGAEFVRLNSRLVTLRPDDILRGMEESVPALRLIRQKCPFVGYDQIRRGTSSPIVSMSMLLRCWQGSRHEAPVSGAVTAIQMSEQITVDEAEGVAAALSVLGHAWGRELENARLWGALNLTLCFWLWRRTVVTKYSVKTSRLSKDLFAKCMMSVAADTTYNDWLLGRKLGERDRSPAYARLKTAVANRFQIETGDKCYLPSPPWSKSHGL